MGGKRSQEAQIGIRQDIRDIASTTGSCNVDDIVCVKGVVCSKGERENVYAHAMRKSLAMCNLIVADETGAIRVTVWESMVQQVTDGASYEFNTFKVNYFNDKYLNGTPESKLVECKVIELPDEVRLAADGMKPKAKESKNVDGRIVGADVNISLVCLNCKTRIEDLGGRFVDCQQCKSSMLRDFLKATVTANLILIDENGDVLGRFHCGPDVLNRLFESIKGNTDYNIEESDVTKLSRKLITETLLLVKKASFELFMDDKKVASITIPLVF